MDDLEWIREGLRRSGKSRSALAQALGRAPSAITSLLGPEKPSDHKKEGAKEGRPTKPRQLKSHEVSTIAKFLGIEPPSFYNLRRVPVIFAGRHSAAPALLETARPKEQREIAVTEGDTSSVAALGLRGGAMLGMKDGVWLFFHGEPISDEIGSLSENLCIFYLDNEEVIVGTLKPSLYNGLFDLIDFFDRKDFLARKVLRAAAVMSMILPPISEAYLSEHMPPVAEHFLKIRKDS